MFLRKKKKVISSLSNTISKYIAYVVVELALSDTPVEPCLLAAQTSPDGFKETAESCAKTLAVSMYLKQKLQIGGDFLSDS